MEELLGSRLYTKALTKTPFGLIASAFSSLWTSSWGHCRLFLPWHLSHEKKHLTFHYTGCLIGILIMVYYNPRLTALGKWIIWAVNIYPWESKSTIKLNGPEPKRRQWFWRFVICFINSGVDYSALMVFVWHLSGCHEPAEIMVGSGPGIWIFHGLITKWSWNIMATLRENPGRFSR